MLVALALACFFSLQVLAAPPKFEVRANRSEISLNETVTLSLVIRDGSYQNLDLPMQNSYYQVISQSTNTNISVVNGQIAPERTIKLVIKPNFVGKMIIPEISVDIKGKPHKSKPITINVIDSPTPKTQSANNQGAIQSQGSIFALTTVNKNEAYKNEQIKLTLKVYHKGNLKEFKIPPNDLDNFLKEQVDEVAEYRSIFNNQHYITTEIQYIIFPLKSGVLEIPAIKIEGSMVTDTSIFDPRDPFSLLAGSFPSLKPIIFDSEPVKITVKDLPPAPAGFSGYVGDLSVNHRLDRKEVAKGEAVTLTTNIYGTGNVAFLDDDFISKTSQYNVFKDKESTTSQIENGIKYSHLTHKSAIVPRKSAKVSIDLKPLINFNPKTKKYEYHGKRNFMIDVKGVAASDKEYKKQAKIKAKKLDKPKEILNISADQIAVFKTQQIPMPIAIAILLILNFIALGVYIYKYSKSFNKSYVESKKIRFSEFEKSIKNADSIAEISTIMKDAVAKFYKAFDGQVENPDLLSRINDFFNRCDQSNYALVAMGIDDIRASSISLLKELKQYRG